jgi:hypothetical protein
MSNLTFSVAVEDAQAGEVFTVYVMVLPPENDDKCITKVWSPQMGTEVTLTTKILLREAQWMAREVDEGRGVLFLIAKGFAMMQLGVEIPEIVGWEQLETGEMCHFVAQQVFLKQ